MGDVWQTDKLALFLAFFVPGFIATEMYALFVSVGERDFTKQAPAIVAYSAIHYAIVGWIVLLAPEGAWRAAAAYVVVLVLPLLWAPAVLLVRDRRTWAPRLFSRNFFSRLVQPDATPWDRIFADTRERWIRVRLKSGPYVGGVLAQGSSTSTYPCPEQVYIREQWRIAADGTFEEPLTDASILINGTEIEFIELL